MAQYRGAVVRKIYSRETGLELEMRLDKRQMEFFVTLPNDHIEAGPEAAVVEREVLKWLKETYAIQWRPVIVVKEKHAFGDNGQDAYIGIESERFWVGQRQDGHWMVVRDWAEDIGQLRMYRADHFYVARGRQLVIPSRLDKEDVILPYSEDTWLGLQKLEAAIRELRGRVRELIGNEEGWDRLALVGRNNLPLLGAGNE